MDHNSAVKIAMLTLAELGCRHIAQRDVGLFYTRDGRPKHIGIKGEADVQALTAAGRPVAVEIKTGNATTTKEQRRWAASFLELGGLYILARFNDKTDGAEIIRRAFEQARQTNALS